MTIQQSAQMARLMTGKDWKVEGNTLSLDVQFGVTLYSTINEDGEDVGGIRRNKAVVFTGTLNAVIRHWADVLQPFLVEVEMGFLIKSVRAEEGELVVVRYPPESIAELAAPMQAFCGKMSEEFRRAGRTARVIAVPGGYEIQHVPRGNLYVMYVPVDKLGLDPRQMGGYMESLSKSLEAKLNELGIFAKVLVAPVGYKLEDLPVETMRQFGWVKSNVG